MVPGGWPAAAVLRVMRWSWTALFAVTLVIMFAVPRWIPLAGGALGGVAVLVGLALAADLAGITRASVDQARASRRAAPVLATMTFARLFGAAFAALGGSFLVLALTGHFH